MRTHKYKTLNIYIYMCVTKSNFGIGRGDNEA